jgi:hypothetical protein
MATKTDTTQTPEIRLKDNPRPEDLDATTSPVARLIARIQ